MSVFHLIALGQLLFTPAGGSPTLIRQLRCSGNMSCAVEANIGTIFIDAGAGLRAVAPLYIDGGFVLCAPAADGVSGCVSAGDQEYSGYKHHKGLLYAEDNYLSSTFMNVPVGLYVPGSGGNAGGICAGSVQPLALGSLDLYGRRGWGSDVASVRVLTEQWRDGGYLFGVNAPVPGCNLQQVGVTENGNIDFGFSYENGCVAGTGGTLRDRSSISGHHSLSRTENHYLTISGALGAEDDIWEGDGGRPLCDGGSWTRLLADGGCTYNYSGTHGDVNIASRYPMYSGLVAEIYNPISGTGAYTDHRAFWDYNGAYAQNHSLSLAQFPAPHLETYFIRVAYGTAPQAQFRFGAYPSTQMYAFDTMHWYFSNDTTWVQFLDTTSSIADSQLASSYSGVGACTNQLVRSVNDNAGPTCSAVSLTADVSGLLPVGNGGTGLGAPIDDTALVGTAGNVYASAILPNCTDTGGQHLNYIAASNAFSCGTSSSGGGGSGNFLEASLALDGAGVYSVVVTGQTWVTSSSKIVCSPFGTTADGLTPEAIAAAALSLSVSDRVVGTGFTLWLDNPRGLTGTVRAHCSGA